jgi:predicted dinucleotide-utilizing enzyme
MDFWIYIVAIVAIGTLGKIATKWLALQKPRRNADETARIDAMEERLRTLERIVTDKRSTLNEQIDRL